MDPYWGIIQQSEIAVAHEQMHGLLFRGNFVRGQIDARF